MLGKFFARFGKFVARFEQHFTRNAADAQTRSAECRFFFDARDIESELRRANRRDISARTCTDDDQIVSFVFHFAK